MISVLHVAVEVHRDDDDNHVTALRIDYRQPPDHATLHIQMAADPPLFEGYPHGQHPDGLVSDTPPPPLYEGREAQALVDALARLLSR